MRLNSVSFIRCEPEMWGEMKIHHSIAQYLFRDLCNGIGVDPGRNWGLSVLQDGLLGTFWGKLPKMNAPDYHEYICNWIRGWFSPNFTATSVVVEGAAYNAQYGRELLEDIRLGFYSAFKELGREVAYVPPLAIRKIVFGNSNIKGNETWLSIGENAADSVAMALYCGGYKYSE